MTWWVSYLGDVAVDDLVGVVHYEVVQLPVGDLLEGAGLPGEVQRLLSRRAHVQDPPLALLLCPLLRSLPLLRRPLLLLEVGTEVDIFQ